MSMDVEPTVPGRLLMACVHEFFLGPLVTVPEGPMERLSILVVFFNFFRRRGVEVVVIIIGHVIQI